MSNNKLELRSPLIVALAYLIAASAAGSFFGLETLAETATDPASRGVNEYAIKVLFGYVIIGSIICILVEVFVITPIIIGFSKFRWKWLNGCTGALIGFFLGSIPALFIGSRKNADGTSELLGYYADGHLTIMGLQHAILDALRIGSVGVVCAVVFRFIAVRSVPATE